MNQPSTFPRGISGIPVTPFDDDDEVDVASLSTIVHRIAHSGIDVLIACGNTGEYSSLTETEIDLVTKTSIDSAEEALPVYVGVGGGIATAKRHSSRAMELGADGVMLHYPSSPYISGSGLVRYYEEIAALVEGPVIVYLRGLPGPANVLQDIVSIDNVCAVKIAVKDLLALPALVQTISPHALPVCGLAEAWAPYFWLAGCEGFTSGLVNVFPEVSIALRDAMRDGDLDTIRRIWDLVRPFEAFRAHRSDALNVSAVKQAMTFQRLADNARVRPPIDVLTADERAELASVVAHLGAFLD
jgi:4-hydroxy-tetrahydrodipicolinate synthase